MAVGAVGFDCGQAPEPRRSLHATGPLLSGPQSRPEPRLGFWSGGLPRGLPRARGVRRAGDTMRPITRSAAVSRRRNLRKLDDEPSFAQTSERISSRRKAHRDGGFGLPRPRSPLSGRKPSSSSESTSRLLRLVEEAMAPPRLVSGSRANSKGPQFGSSVADGAGNHGPWPVAPSLPTRRAEVLYFSQAATRESPHAVNLRVASNTRCTARRTMQLGEANKEPTLVCSAAAPRGRRRPAASHQTSGGSRWGSVGQAVALVLEVGGGRRST